MFNKQLKQRIVVLEDALQKAASYHDGADYECPLCGALDPNTLIPVTYCSLHRQIALLEIKIVTLSKES